MSTEQHRATFRTGPSGTWLGCCAVCGVASSETAQATVARAWCHGHDAAVARARHVAASWPPFFADVGPGEAITLAELTRVIDTAATYLAQLGHGEVEVLQPANQIPWLYLWTPASVRGEPRTRLAGICIERSGEFVPEQPREAWTG